MASSNDSGREERRRRIMDRGSDRIALITGLHRGQDIPSSIDGQPSGGGDSSISSSSPRALPPRIPVAGGDPFKEASGSGGQPEKDPVLGLEAAAREGIIEQQLAPAAAQLHQQRDRRPPNNQLFSSKRLNTCIIESERMRGFCAFIIAVLVVLSYVGYPLFGSHIVKSGSIIASRPLYILLLTDATIVLARLLNAQRDPATAAAEEEGGWKNAGVGKKKGENQNWDGAVKLLERGLVAYQSVRAIFIDCSIYMVVVICGLSQV